jgi:apolipoprotein D and lipocalin family protein
MLGEDNVGVWMGAVFWLRSVAAWLLIAGTAQAAGIAPVASVDLPRFMGTWYEIARTPNRFQADCAGDVTATYALREDGTLSVVNRCLTDKGEALVAEGVAKVVGPAKLKVRFAPAWMSWFPPVWGDYWVFDLDPGYRLAAVGDAEGRLLWILSRTPAIDAETYAALLNRLMLLDLHPARLVATPQSGR